MPTVPIVIPVLDELGTMRCPAGARVSRLGPKEPYRIEDDGVTPSEQPIKPKGKAMKPREFHRCKEKKCPVRQHPSIKGVLVVRCPEHGDVDASEAIWKGEVR